MKANCKVTKLLLVFILESALFLLIISCASNMTLTIEKDPNLKQINKFISHVRKSQGNLDSHYLLGSYLQERGRHEEAVEEFQKVLLIDPNYIKAYNGIGVSYDFLGDHLKAIEAYQKALKLNPNLDYVANNLGYSYLLRGCIDESISMFEKAIALNPNEMKYHNNLGLAFAKKDRFDLALAQFIKAGDEAKAHYNIAQLYYEKGLYDKAKDHYEIALRLNPRSTMIQTGLDIVKAINRVFKSSSEERKSESVGQELPVTNLSDIETYCKVEIATNLFRAANLSRKEEVTSSDIEDRELDFIREIGIEISNGNGVNGMARNVGNYLKGRGLSVVRLTNASHFKHLNTKIFHREGYHHTAEFIGKQLPVFQITKVKNLDRANIHIKVIIGKDLIPYHKIFKESNS